MFWITLVIGLAGTAVALALAGRRVLFLYKIAKSGQPDPERTLQVKRDPKKAVEGQAVEVFGQRKLLKWTVAGAAHFAVMWAFFLLATVYLEAYGAFQAAFFGLDFHIPLSDLGSSVPPGHHRARRLAGWSPSPRSGSRTRRSGSGRKSRFKGSHLAAPGSCCS